MMYICSMYLAKIKVDSRKEWKNGPWDVPKSFELNSWSKKLIVVRVRSLISRKSKLKDEMWEKIDFSPQNRSMEIYIRRTHRFLVALSKENKKRVACLLFSDYISKLTNTITLVSLSIKETRRSTRLPLYVRTLTDFLTRLCIMTQDKDAGF